MSGQFAVKVKERPFREGGRIDRVAAPRPADVRTPVTGRSIHRSLRRLTVAAIVLALFTAVGAAPASAKPQRHYQRDVTPIASLDLGRYAGRWLQLATIPQFFQAPCVRDTQAFYTVLPDGLVQVDNTCVRADGSSNAIEGRARVVGPSPAQLDVTFVQIAGQWIFEAAGDYWVLGVDQRSPDYAWAVVGNADRSSGFVLSRTPRLSPRQILRIGVVLVRNGYDPCDFEITATTGGIERNLSLCDVR